MLTKNFFNDVMSRYAGSAVTGGLTDTSGAVWVSGGYASTTTPFSNMKTLTISSSYGEGVRIGSGVTPATPDDYKLETLISDNCSVSTPSTVLASVDADGVSVSATYAVKNTGSTAFSVSEIGLFSGLYTVINNNGQKKTCMVDRTVLEKPITINPGESKQITYTIRFNYPTA